MLQLLHLLRLLLLIPVLPLPLILMLLNLKTVQQIIVVVGGIAVLRYTLEQTIPSIVVVVTIHTMIHPTVTTIANVIGTFMDLGTFGPYPLRFLFDNILILHFFIIIVTTVILILSSTSLRC